MRCQLDDVATYIEAAPDSALAVLEGIPSGHLRTRSLKAEHALLHSIALDRCYIDMAEDSIINVAVKWYSDHGDNEEKMLSYYYLGRVHMNAGNYTQSIVSFTMALDNAEQANNTFYKGLIYRGLADIYGLTFNHNEELRNRQSEYESKRF